MVSLDSAIAILVPQWRQSLHSHSISVHATTQGPYAVASGGGSFAGFAREHSLSDGDILIASLTIKASYTVRIVVSPS